MLDVTDPENPAYCFLTGYASHDEHPETQDMPLDAYGYLSAYYDLNEDPGQTADVADKDEADENGKPYCMLWKARGTDTVHSSLD